jgi:hypothetical protein
VFSRLFSPLTKSVLSGLSLQVKRVQLDISVRHGLQGADVSLPLTVVNTESRRLRDYWPYFAVLALSAGLALAYAMRHGRDSSAQRDQHSPTSPVNSANATEVDVEL